MADQKKTEEQVQKILKTPIDESGYCTPEQIAFILKEYKEREK